MSCLDARSSIGKTGRSFSESAATNMQRWYPKKYLFLEESHPQLQSGCENFRLQPQPEPFGQPQILLGRSSLAVSRGVPSPASERRRGFIRFLRTELSRNCALYSRKIRKNGLLFGRWMRCIRGRSFAAALSVWQGVLSPRFLPFSGFGFLCLTWLTQLSLSDCHNRLKKS